MRKTRWRIGILGALAVAATTLVVGAPAAAAATQPPRVDLRVLVVTDGTPWVEGIKQTLTDEGVPFTAVNLADSARPAISAAFLADTVNGAPRAKFQGVVLPGDAPSGLTADEQAALATYETTYAVRQINGFVYPSANTGFNTPTFAGSIDGATATVTSQGLAGPFANLKGPVKFDDNDPSVAESYAYLATPLPDDPATGRSFTPMLNATVGGTSGTLAGVYKVGTREQLSLAFAYNYYQMQYRNLSHGLLTWLTKGVHLGYSRDYLTVHVDDAFLEDSRWSASANCTPGEGDCPAGTADTTPIRMIPADVTAAVQWQQANHYTFNILFNGGGSDQYVAANGSDPLLTAFLQNRNQFQWLNHTYTHQFLGCVQDFTVIPWRCAKNPDGSIQYVSQATIASEINKNITFAQQKGLTIRRGELVGGEHSGTKILPQQPDDNPNFVAQLSASRITSLGLDASRESTQRQVGSAASIPRHPLTVYFNTATRADMVDEYNWIYTSRANGGSGVCEDNPATTTCVTPLSGPAAYDSYIVPQATGIALGFITANDPRPSYAHVSNLAEDRLLLPLMTSILNAYNAAYAANAPVVTQTQTDAAAELGRETTWRNIAGGTSVTAYVQGTTVTVTGPSGTTVPLTMPQGTQLGNGNAFGTAYANELSAYQGLGNRGTTLTVTTAPYPGSTAPAASSAPTTSGTTTPGTTTPRRAPRAAAQAQDSVAAPQGNGLTPRQATDAVPQVTTTAPPPTTAAPATTGAVPTPPASVATQMQKVADKAAKLRSPIPAVVPNEGS